MNMRRDALPPVNNALLPDIYDKLEADTIEKTRVANTVLDIRLSVEQKVIAKYKREAERMLQSQMTKAAADLSRIGRRLSSELMEPSLENGRKKVFQKGYMTGKNEELICHRCYIHHLPSKKRFYAAEPRTPPSKMFGAVAHHMPIVEKTESGSEAGKATPTSQGKGSSATRSTSEVKADNHNWKVIAPIEKYKFLERDLCGRDKDLNNTLTPRLVPYEDWKKVVKNVCSQCNRKFKGTARGPPSRRANFSREKTADRFRERKKSISRQNSTRRRSSTKSPAASEYPSHFQANSHRASGSYHRKLLQTSPSRQASDDETKTFGQENMQSGGSSRSRPRLQRERSPLTDNFRSLKGDDGSSSVSSSSAKQGKQSPSKAFQTGRSRSKVSFHNEIDM